MWIRTDQVTSGLSVSLEHVRRIVLVRRLDRTRRAEQPPVEASDET
jgi:hypothetical protein